MTTKRKLTRRFDQAWGEDRYEHSPYCGQITQEIIILWKAPGVRVAAANMSGALAHGSYVQIVSTTMYKGRSWFKVMCDVEHEGEIKPQVGWVADRMLRKRGEGAFE